jgi:hypothetical protein
MRYIGQFRQTKKSTDISRGFGNRPFHDAFDFGRVRFNTPLGNVVPQKVDFKEIEMTFLRITIQSSFCSTFMTKSICLVCSMTS